MWKPTKIEKYTVQRTGHCPAFPTFRAMAKKSAESLEVSKFLCTFATENFNTQRNSRDMTNNKPTREELLLRVEASKERKRKRLAEMEIRARELFKERTGEEPKYVYSL